jgi:hypothetical protein
MSHPYGQACARAAFDADELAGVDAAVAAIQEHLAGPVVATLTMAIDPRHWPQTRSAVSGLRRQGPAAVCAAPAIAGWVKLCAGRATTPEQQHTVHDALLALAEMRRMAANDVVAEPAAAVLRVGRFLDEAFQPYLLSTLVPPLRIWQRGAVTYLRGLHGDLEQLAAALQHFAQALQEAPAERDDWYAYLRMELIALVADLGPQLEWLHIERAWREEPG